MWSSRFRPGHQQSLDATTYFQELAGELLHTYLPEMSPTQFLVDTEGVSSLPLRLWSAHAEPYAQVAERLDWIRSQLDYASRFRSGSVARADVERFGEGLFNEQSGTATFFIEVLDTAHPFTMDEANELSIAIVGGHVVMLSAMNVMYMEVEPGVFGLSIANHGSYLWSPVALPPAGYVMVPVPNRRGERSEGPGSANP